MGTRLSIALAAYLIFSLKHNIKSKDERPETIMHRKIS